MFSEFITIKLTEWRKSAYQCRWSDHRTSYMCTCTVIGHVLVNSCTDTSDCTIIRWMVCTFCWFLFSHQWSYLWHRDFVFHFRMILKAKTSVRYSVISYLTVQINFYTSNLAIIWMCESAFIVKIINANVYFKMQLNVYVYLK